MNGIEIKLSSAEVEAILPATILFVTGLVVLLVDPFLRRKGDTSDAATPKSHLGLLGAAGAMLALASIWLGSDAPAAGGLFAGALRDDAFGDFAAAIIILTAFLTSLCSGGYLASHRSNYGEYYSLLFFGAGAMVLLCQATNLLSMFVAIETLSLSVYVLAGFFRDRRNSTEGALKYFVMGAFSSGFLLFGMVLLYGSSGSIALTSFAGGDVDPVLLSTGLLLCLIGFAFKVGAVPFHSWVPDAYQGAPVVAAGWMAVAVKVSAFAALIRLVYAVSASTAGTQVANMVAAVAVVTMIMGNLAALNQRNMKRMLAYSGIAHSGYLLIPLVLTLRTLDEKIDDLGASALFYLGAYGFMTLGAFTAVAIVSRGNQDREQLDEFNGLARRHPLVALALTVSLISLAGIPLTGGFQGKLMIFLEAFRNSDTLYLAVIGVIAALVSVYYYIRPVVAMYFHEEERPVVTVETPWALNFTLFVTTIGTLALGLFPDRLMQLSRSSIGSLFS